MESISSPCACPLGRRVCVQQTEKPERTTRICPCVSALEKDTRPLSVFQMSPSTLDSMLEAMKEARIAMAIAAKTGSHNLRLTSGIRDGEEYAPPAFVLRPSSVAYPANTRPIVLRLPSGPLPEIAGSAA